jgi:DNA polymerase III delta prime subunit
MLSEIVNTKENLNSELNDLFVVLEHLIASHSNFILEKDENDKSTVIAINGKHGAGKTTFLKLFINRILSEVRSGREKEYVYQYSFRRDIAISFSGAVEKSKKQIIPIWYDAWQNDDFDDPFLSLVGQICQQANINTSEITSIKNIAWEVTKTTGKILVKTTGKIAEKTVGLDIDTAVKEYSKLAKKINKKTFNDQVKLYGDLESKKRSFKNALSVLGAAQNSGVAPIKVIFIDELDRCTPTYAVKLLEKIKHFFNAENTVFIMTIDKAQLESIIQKVYGNEFDANHYLSRFFDFEIKIPLSNDFFNRIQQKYFPEGEQLVVTTIAKFYDMQPREQIKFYRLLKFLSSTGRAWNRDVYYLLVGLKIVNTTSLNTLRLLREEDINTVIKILNPNKNLELITTQESLDNYPILAIILNLMLLLARASDKAENDVIEKNKSILKERSVDIDNYKHFLNISNGRFWSRDLEDLLKLLEHFN